MKKITVVSIVSLAFLVSTSLIEILLRPLLRDQVTALVIGVALLTASGALAIFVRDKRVVNILCLAISSVSMGFLLRAWYINRGFNNSFPLMLAVSLASVVYLWLFFALSKIPFVKKSKAVYAVLCALYAVASLAAYLLVMLNTDTTYVSTFGYYMIIELAFIFAMSLEVNSTDELIRNLALSSYSVFVVAIIVAVFVLVAAGGGDCDCDCGPADCCDGGCFDRAGDGKRKRRRQ